ncbi:sigma-54-dependent transcriptional regulator [Pseudochryseolinea flava]|uniref:Sigma-54-dependent Fis family transcriptional regulator n=1 Tax=Pseudochryseolinea flava TaxID=2059302 RepID=A0A364Y4G6_9BACT|nr:sigma-54 dependent transcriptional regulator [Pseudochryseolinea flava]RAW01777.1 sigma-54-dependent Fis family transcriptional regulator [Pseudochryseolinea flava]
MAKILIVDDEKDLCLVLNRFLSKHGFQVIEANKGKKALELLSEDAPDLILCDFKLDDMDGTSVLKAIKEVNPSIPVIIITGYSNIKTAVEVMRLGAVDYVTKPLIPDEILMTIRRALEGGKNGDAAVTTHGTNGSADVKHNNTTKRVAGKADPYIFGDSPYFKNILKQIDLVAPTNYSVIIYGESGSGKEAIAQEIHKRSKRHNKPFVAIDCGVLSKELAGSELFGHEKGAFTGALNQKIGSFEIANEGTIFLDEIANLSYDVQISLLRVVQERKMRRVGGTKDIDLDVRIIVASNEKLWDTSGRGKLREDLYHRFNEFTINVAPLRERQGDIMVFASHFLKLANNELNKNITGFHPEVEKTFRNYVWYGNLRELKNVVKRATLLCDEDVIDVKSIPFELSNFSKLQFEPASEPVAVREAQEEPQQQNMPVKKMPFKEPSLKSVGLDAEYEVILEALKKVNFNKSKAAKVLQIDRKTLYNKIKQYHELKGEPYEPEL